MTMSTKGDEKQPEDRMEGRRPWIRVDGAQLGEAATPAGAYRVRISGHNLKMAISPPRILVGGVELTDLEFDPDGKHIAGTMSQEPDSDEVHVDYGFATGHTTLSRS